VRFVPLKQILPDGLAATTTFLLPPFAVLRRIPAKSDRGQSYREIKKSRSANSELAESLSAT
jgi:hypothetical protein